MDKEFVNDDIINQQLENVESENVSDTPVEDDFSIDDLLSDIHSDIDKGLSKIIDMETDDAFFKTEYKIINALLGNKGFPEGKLIQFVGNPGSFKSAFATNIAGQFQNFHDKNGELNYVLYLDSENSMYKERLADLGLKNITPANVYKIQDVFESIDSLINYKNKKLEEINKIIKNLKVNTSKGITPSVVNKQKNKYKEMKDKLNKMHFLVIWDSLANTLSGKEMENKGEINKVIGEKAKLLSNLLPAYIPVMKQNNITLFLINQLRDNINMDLFSYTPPELKFLNTKFVIPGGKAVKFNSQLLFNLENSSVLKEEEWGFKGVKVVANAIKNKYFTPNIKMNLIFKFKTGYSEFWTEWLFLKDNMMYDPEDESKVMNGLKIGSYCSLYNYDGKFRRKDAEYKYRNEPEFSKAWDYVVDKTIEKWIADVQTEGKNL